MYSSFQLAKKYLTYYIKAQNGKGHGVHSPFVFDFITHVLNDKKEYECYKKIEALRQQLLNDNSIIEVEDFGAGSAVIPFKKRKINAIAKSSLKNKKFAKLLYRIVNNYKPESIVELGTSFGITTCYIACANKDAEINTFEGSKQIAKIARQNFEQTGFRNINLTEGDFNKTFVAELRAIKKVDFAFIDGNHRRDATLDYFLSLLKKSSNTSIFIFDDIHWSSEMEEAWRQIQEHDSVTLTIDLFFIGLVFFNPDFKVKQHFTIRF
ncbi:class I SAM-dependent methyltransferase [Ginsengibacter hankyongi]|uniref:Class I SAM-dependent methyltransferase n=1 Tax=Ginsengibacter hankyongi TaxID=2607284 RepID=A0A5J5IIU8_9BACT|nr:class I SAM-dependent methyltransferase [Ginsengibacter hankyongi]KAA9039262.1 class I SAM-dependent methyltransferase [Ginsengibacter hankyongi]